jgi:hypothetical protein
MRPFVSLPFNSESLSYGVGISTKTNVIDQRRNTIQLLPGYQITIKTIPQLVGATDQFKKMDVTTRNCKLAGEIDGLKLINTYSKVGCEIECATNKAIEICRCLPWYFTNNFTGTPMCDSFGGHCFEEILTNEANYKKCSKWCIEDCSGMPMTVVNSYVPINLDEACKRNSYFEKHFVHSSRQYFTFEIYRSLIEGDGQIPDLQTNLANGTLCRNFISKFVALVSVESPTDSITKSAREIRVTLIDQIGTVGGTLGLFTGMSILSMVEIAFFFVKFIRSFFKIKQSDFLTIEKKPQEPNLPLTGTNCHPDCDQKFKEHEEEIRQLKQFKEKVKHLEELVYMLLPEEKRHLIQIEERSKTILPASKSPQPKSFELKDLEINVDQIKVYILKFLLSAVILHLIALQK